MKALKIGIVNSSSKQSVSIINSIVTGGHLFWGFTESVAALAASILVNMPDLLIFNTDFNDPSVFDIIEYLDNQNYIPYIFFSDNSNLGLQDTAKTEALPVDQINIYKKESLSVFLNNIFSNASLTNVNGNHNSNGKVCNDYIFIKDENYHKKILLDDILFIESQHNYIDINLSNGRKLTIRACFNEFIESMPPARFKITHRCFAVNVKHIEKIGPADVYVNSIKVPLVKKHIPALKTALGIFEG